MSEKLKIGVDFDGTVVKWAFPKIGDPVPHALNVLRRVVAQGHHIVLWTVRSGVYLQEAVDYLNDNGIPLWGINRNPTQSEWSDSPKAHCDIFIDDAALGCPLVHVAPRRRPYVDWYKVDKLLKDLWLGDF